MLPKCFSYINTEKNGDIKIEVYSPNQEYVLRINSIHLESGTIYEDNITSLYKTKCPCYEVMDVNNRFQPFKIHTKGKIVVTNGNEYLVADVKEIPVLVEYSVLICKDEKHNIIPCKDLTIMKINQAVECISLETKSGLWMLDNGIFVINKTFVELEQEVDLRIIPKDNIRTRKIETHIMNLEDITV